MRLQVVPDRNLAALPVLLIEVQHALFAGMIETAALERGHRACAGGGVDENRDDGAITELDHVAGADAGQQLPSACDGDLGRLALDHLVALAADGKGRVQNDGVPGGKAANRRVLRFSERADRRLSTR